MERLDYVASDVLLKDYSFPDFNKQNLYIPVYNWIEAFDIPEDIKDKIKNIYFTHNGSNKLISASEGLGGNIDLYIFTGEQVQLQIDQIKSKHHI
ncbi:hypothetical protein [Francisella sp. SYW-9]|uniref:hypothetical protein n=1 Tax=Francisella sp. SYW-9 TaxID=2610888 RepID=UPI00123D2E31|nr:hypothetical protein [Francisella sp. SYW-9]